MLSSRRRALAFTIGWWLLRRRLRKSAASAALGLLAGEGIAAAPKKRHRVRNLLLVAGLGAAAFLVWKRLQGGTDDWGAWEPEPPAPAPGPAAESAPPAAA